MPEEAPQICRSPFLQPAGHTNSGSLAILHLRRDQLTPVILSQHDENDEGYDEGKVTNTRFGSFPHSTLIDLPWGSQIRASKVDTGSRGRRAAGQKRKRAETDSVVEVTTESTESTAAQAPKAAIAAQTGFAHLLAPTPENWTISLPHRTQVVYTPDYSFILQRLKARPGTQIIEAGAGSGSFTHAAARAIYNGCHSATVGDGKVWSFEFHEQRAEKLKCELGDHGLEGVVEVNHRDVYNDGFSVKINDHQVVQANAVFLDLPAPWLALPHLKRKVSTKNGKDKEAAKSPDLSSGDETNLVAGPLSSLTPIHICCFLPCIEQVQKTVSALQANSWQHISVVEVAAQRIEIRRERVGINEEGVRGSNSSPANVDEALVKLKKDENRTQAFHQINQRLAKGENTQLPDRNGVKTKQERLRENQEASEQRKIYKEGRLIHKSEPELKLHTSYLLFATLPREWSVEDETNAAKRWNRASTKTKMSNTTSDQAITQEM